MSSTKSKSVKRASSMSKKPPLGQSTPECGSLPSTSGTSIGVQQEPSIDEVLRGRDVQALRVREDDLRKLHPPKPPSSLPPERKARRVLIRRPHPPPSDVPPRPRHKGVVILHPIPPGTAVSAKRTLGSPPAGPRFDARGTFLAHSVLGPSEDYAGEMKNRGMVSSTSAFSRPPPVVLPEVESPPTTEEMTYEKTIVPRETHALSYWNRSMEERKLQQEYLAAKLQSSPERLAMNQGEGYRTVQEERMLVDRAMPSVDYGKGYRVGSEFWSQQVRIGNETTGVNITLTATERGLPPELEYVGVPTAIRKEKGIDFGVGRNAPLHYTWSQSAYLGTRRRHLGATLADIEPFHPEVSKLQVIGHTPRPAPSHPRADSLDSEGEQEDVGSSSEEEGEEEEEEGEGEGLLGSSSILDLQPDVTSRPIVGPALRVGGHMLKWEGPPSEGEGHTAKEGEREWNPSRQPLDIRVLFEAGVGEKATSHLLMENCGTAAVYYSWQHLPRPNPLGVFQAGGIQRFYFDTRGGVLLPGQKLSFPFTFKSPSAGVFSETWALQTGSVLAGGRPLVVTLRGVAFQEDLHARRREEIEEMLTHRIAMAAAERVVDTLVGSICTPAHSPEPMETTALEEDVFLARNPGVFYHYNAVQQLKGLYDEIMRPGLTSPTEEVLPEPSGKLEKEPKKGKVVEEKGGKKEKTKAGKGKPLKEEPSKESVSATPVPPPEKEPVPVTEEAPGWDLSIAGLQEVIVGTEDDEKREERLQRLSALVGALSVPPPSHGRTRAYAMSYQVLCEAVDSIAAASSRLCLAMGVPVRDFSPGETSKPGGAEDESLSTVPSSPAQGGKGKKGAKKADSKQKASKEKERAPSRGKSSRKSSKVDLLAKDADTTEGTSEAPTVEVDAVTEAKYKDGLYTAVYGILGSAVEMIGSLLGEL